MCRWFYKSHTLDLHVRQNANMLFENCGNRNSKSNQLDCKHFYIDTMINLSARLFIASTLHPFRFVWIYFFPFLSLSLTPSLFFYFIYLFSCSLFIISFHFFSFWCSFLRSIFLFAEITLSRQQKHGRKLPERRTETERACNNFVITFSMEA